MSDHKQRSGIGWAARSSTRCSRTGALHPVGRMEAVSLALMGSGCGRGKDGTGMDKLRHAQITLSQMERIGAFSITDSIASAPRKNKLCRTLTENAIDEATVRGITQGILALAKR